AESSSAANSTITASNEANVFFSDTASGGDAVIIATSGGGIIFLNKNTRGEKGFFGRNGGVFGFSQFLAGQKGGVSADSAEGRRDCGAIISLGDDSSAAEATFIVNGGTASGAAGGVMSVFGRANAANASITVNGGSGGGGGGSLVFAGTALGGLASISLSGDG